METVSIIITCYNTGEYLKETYESVIAQTYKSVEIIVVDDGSTDKLTMEELDLIEEEGYLVIRKSNGGVSSARNVGIQYATGDYIIFLDGDDLIEPNYVDELMKIMMNTPDVKMVYSNTLLFGDKNYLFPLGTPTYEKLLIFNQYFVITGLYKKNRILEIGGFNEEMRYGIEDWEFLIRYCEEGMKIARVNKPLFKYRIRRLSRTMGINESIKKTFLMRLEILRNNADIYSKYPFVLKKFKLTHFSKYSILNICKKTRNWLLLKLSSNREITVFTL